VVWSLPPQGDSGGPTSISRAAPHHEALPTSSSPPRPGRKETITNNIRKVIVDERAMNPKYYDKMSQLLDAIY